MEEQRNVINGFRNGFLISSLLWGMIGLLINALFY